MQARINRMQSCGGCDGVLSDEDLDELEHFYAHLRADLSLLGPAFALAESEVRTRVRRVQEMQYARGRKSAVIPLGPP